DVESAARAGIDFRRFLWIRGQVTTNPGLCRDASAGAMEQAVKALSLVLQAGNFGLVALDIADAPRDAVRRLPFTTWLRLQRMVEGRSTACVLVAAESIARSSAGLTLQLGVSAGAREARGDRRTRITGTDVEARIVRARTRGHEDVRVSVSTSG